MTLEVLICTFNERVLQVPSILLPEADGVCYLVSFQYSDESYLKLLDEVNFRRTDVKVVTLKGKGLSANRNNALTHAKGDVLLIADDDVRYRPEYFERILQRFEENETLDIACFQAKTLDGKPLHHYADYSFTYHTQPRGTYFLSIEIAVRRTESLPRFNERYGICSDYLASGEEEVFLNDAFQKRLKIQYFPEVIVETNADTTGRKLFTDKAVQRSKGAVLCHMYGPVSAWLRCLKYILTQPWQGSRFQGLKEMTKGIVYEKQAPKLKVQGSPQVSLIIPYYNREEYFSRTLRSVAALSYRPLQIILVDNGSTDNSSQLAEQFKKRYQTKNFQIELLQEIKQGAAAARNKGLESAQGEYVYFFDSDDEMSDGFLEDAVSMAQSENLDLVAAVTRMVHPNGNEEVRRYGYSCSVAHQIVTGMLSTQSIFFKTTFLQRIGGWNENLLYWNDWELGLRVLLSHPKMKWLKGQAFHRIYLHDDSITGPSFHEAFSKICTAFSEAEKDLVMINDTSAWVALCYREALVAGHLFHEGYYEQAEQCFNLSKNYSLKYFPKHIGYWLYRYTRKGCKAGWRFALFFLN